MDHVKVIHVVIYNMYYISDKVDKQMSELCTRNT